MQIDAHAHVHSMLMFIHDLDIEHGSFCNCGAYGLSWAQCSLLSNDIACYAGLYSKSAAQLYAAQLASSGLPKSNSVHDLDMGDMQPVAAKRRGRAAARRNLPSAPEGYTQGWGQAQPGYPGTMPGRPSLHDRHEM